MSSSLDGEACKNGVSELERGLCRAGRTIFVLFGSTIMVARAERETGACGDSGAGLESAVLRRALPRAATSELRRGRTRASTAAAAPTGARAGGGRRASITRTDARSPIGARVHVSGVHFLSSQVCGASARSPKSRLSGRLLLALLRCSSRPPLVSVLRQASKRRRRWTAQGLRRRPRWT